MRHRLLVMSLVLPVCALVLVGHARAQTITSERLAGEILTGDQLNQILAGAGVDATFTRVTDLDPQTGERVGQCRLFGSDAGYAAAICLFANADGSDVDRSV